MLTLKFRYIINYKINYIANKGYWFFLQHPDLTSIFASPCCQKSLIVACPSWKLLQDIKLNKCILKLVILIRNFKFTVINTSPIQCFNAHKSIQLLAPKHVHMRMKHLTNYFEIFHGRVPQPVLYTFLLEIFMLIVENIADNLLSTGWWLVFKDYFGVQIII